MGWLDYGFHSNPKIIQVGNAGAGAYAKMLSYCSANLTDGYVPKAWAHRHISKEGRKKGVLSNLLRTGLIEETEAGYRIPDYLEYNPSKDEVERKRLAARKRKQKERDKRDETTPPVARDVTRDTSTMSHHVEKRRVKDLRPDSPIAVAKSTAAEFARFRLREGKRRTG